MSAPINADSSPMKMQVAFVTNDLEDSLEVFARITGLPFPAISAQEPADVAQAHLAGVPAVIEFRQAAFVWRGTIIEFIEPGPGPSTWRDFLDRRGPGVHHLGFAVDDFVASRSELEEMGLPVLQSGKFSGGQYAYMDAEADLGVVVELLQVDRDTVKELGLD